MAKNLNPGQKQALEACVQDSVSYMQLFFKAQNHPKAALLFNGLIANASMFVIESHRCLTTLFPEINDVISKDHVELLHASRHRAKLLDHTEKTIEEITEELVAIAEEQRKIFLQPHKGILGPLKKALQPDMGLSTYNNHIFTTTHTTIFEFGGSYESVENSFAFGKAIGFYIGSLLNLLDIEIQSSSEPANFAGELEMRDIKYEALYSRGPLGSIKIDFSAGLILILANLNFAHYILPGLLPLDSHALFRMKFITAFHANSNMKLMQARLMAIKSGNPIIEDFFREALGNNDSRWLRKQKRLRNLLTHYLPDTQTASKIQAGATRIDAIELLSGGISYDEINILLTRNIAHLSSLLESGFDLIGDPFWLGKVK